MKYLINFSYNGVFYNGFAKQVGLKTVEGSLENLLTKRFNKKIKIYGSGRTDRGVHSLDSYAHFSYEKEIDLNKLKKYLNDALNGETFVKSVKIVEDDFHARFSIKSKTYLYKINTGEFNPIEKDICFQYNKKINIDLLNKASLYLIGKHDFKAFTPPRNIQASYVREIFDITIESRENYVFLYFKGNGFLQYMIRNIVGLLLEINEGKRKENELKEILLSKDKTRYSSIATQCGLYLYNTEY